MLVDRILITVLIGAQLLAVAGLLRSLQLHPVPLLSRVSIRHRARAVLSRPRPHVRVRQFGQTHQGVTALTIFLCFAALTFGPAPHIGFPPLDNPEDAAHYLTSLWQVLATVLGVSIVLIAFVLQAFVGANERRYGGTLREFALESGLIFIIDIAASSLVIDGIVLLGNLRDAPAGWAGGMAILLSTVAVIALLTMVPRLVLRIIDPERLRRARGLRTLQAVDTALREQIVGQIGDQLIWTHRDVWRITRGLTPTSPDIVTARQDGYLHDLRLGTLRRVVRKLPAGSFEVLTTVGDEVDAGEALLSLPEPLPRALRWRARRAFVIRPRSTVRSSQALNRALDQLAQQGIAAIRARQESGWREVGDLYREILVRFPRLTKALGLSFAGAVSRPGLLGRGPVDRVFDDLRDAYREVLAVDDPGIAEALAHLPLFVAGDVATLDAPAMISDALGIYVPVYLLSRDATQGMTNNRAGVLLLNRSVECLFDGLDRISGYGPRHGYRPLSDADALKNMRVGLAAAQSLMRSLISAGDEPRLETSLKRMSDLTEPWVEAPNPSDALREIQAAIDGALLVLTMWAAHLHADAEQPKESPFAAAVVALLLRLDDGDRVLKAYELVTDDRERSLGEDWSYWFYDDTAGGVQQLSGGLHIERAVVLALVNIALSQGDIALEPADVLEHRVDGLNSALDSVANDARWDFLAASQSSEEISDLDPAAPRPLRDALERVRAALDSVAKDQTQTARAQVRQAGLDSNQVERFRRATVRAAADQRLIRDLLHHVDASRRVPAPTTPQILSRNWIDKRFFIGDRSFVGQDMTARQLARGATIAERQALLNALKPDGEIRAQDIAQVVRDTIRGFRDDGATPSLVLVPIGFELAGALRLQPYSRQPLATPAVPVMHNRQFNGEIDGVPVLHDPRISREHLFVVDLEGAVRFEEWTSDSNSGIEVDVRDFDANTAEAFVDENPTVVAPDATRDDTILLLRESVLIEVRRCWRIAGRNPNATKAIAIPSAFQRRDRD